MHPKQLALLPMICVFVGVVSAPANAQTLESASAYAIPSATTASPLATAAIPSATAAIPSATAEGAPAQFPSLQAGGHQPAAEAQSSDSFAGPTITVISSLAVVLGLFAGLVWLTRRYGGGSARAGSIPSDVIQNLGSTVLDARTRVTMLRCGNKIIVAAQTAGGVHPLCEITDPREVIELTAACTGQTPPPVADSSQATSTRSRLFATA